MKWLTMLTHRHLLVRSLRLLTLDVRRLIFVSFDLYDVSTSKQRKFIFSLFIRNMNTTTTIIRTTKQRKILRGKTKLLQYLKILHGSLSSLHESFTVP